MTEATLLVDVYGLLLAGIRKNRAARLATQARAGALACEETADDESTFAAAMREASNDEAR